MLEDVKLKAFVKSVHWGIMAVLARPTITDIAAGQESRQCLLGFKNTYLKDEDYKLDDSTMKRIDELIAIDGDAKKSKT